VGDRTPPGYAHFDLIDDMEDGDINIRPAGGRVGTWSSFSDGTASGTESFEMSDMDPPHIITGDAPAGAVSKHAVHIQGGGYSGWGAGWMVDFNAETTRLPYDASKYAGVVFWARSRGAPTEVKVAFPDLLSDTAGGICDPNDTRVGGRGCYDDYAQNITLTQEWRRYEIAFTSIITGNWGLRHQFDAQHLFGMKFSVMPSYALFDAWVDDLAFYSP
jgi:hypothetical protein